MVWRKINAPPWNSGVWTVSVSFKRTERPHACLSSVLSSFSRTKTFVQKSVVCHRATQRSQSCGAGERDEQMRRFLEDRATKEIERDFMIQQLLAHSKLLVTNALKTWLSATKS